MTYTEEDFKRMTGSDPVDDDLERLNCEQAGQLCHFHCGYCPQHDKPRAWCGCWQNLEDK